MRTIGLSANGRVVGEHHPRAKLTFAKVEEMRHLRNEHGLTFKALGEHFGVSGRTAWQIVRGKTWNAEAAATRQQATEQDKARVLELMAQGLGPASIARAMGVTRYSVSRLTTGIPRPLRPTVSMGTHCPATTFGLGLMVTESANSVAAPDSRQLMKAQKWHALQAKARYAP